MFLTDISLKRPVLATVCIIALLALGAISFFGLGSDEFPPAEFPYVTVTVVQTGASPDQIEDNVTKEVGRCNRTGCRAQTYQLDL